MWTPWPISHDHTKHLFTQKLHFRYDSSFMSHTSVANKMASTDSMVSNAPCHLLNSPSELRLKIYEFLFPPGLNSLATMVDGDQLITRSRNGFQRNTSILLTCRQIHTEAGSVPHENTIVELYMARAASYGHIFRYGKELGSHNFLRFVNHVDIKVPKQDCILELLSDFADSFGSLATVRRYRPSSSDVESLSGLSADQDERIMYTIRDREYNGKVALRLTQAQKSELEKHYEVLERVLGAVSQITTF